MHVNAYCLPYIFPFPIELLLSLMVLGTPYGLHGIRMGFTLILTHHTVLGSISESRPGSFSCQLNNCPPFLDILSSSTAMRSRAHSTAETLSGSFSQDLGKNSLFSCCLYVLVWPLALWLVPCIPSQSFLCGFLAARERLHGSISMVDSARSATYT